MAENEKAAAHSLVELLRASGVDARAVGAGLHWHVDVGPIASRTLRVHCFWYERAISALMLGMNPANSRSGLRDTCLPYEGPEYLVILNDGCRRVADGRTRNASEVVACAQAWLAPIELGALVREVPFVDKKPRAMRALAERLDSRLRWEILEEPLCELWIYGDDRSCNIGEVNDKISCSFFLGQAQIADASNLNDVQAAVAGWLLSRSSVSALANEVPSVELARHAEVLAIDPARWHWLHLSDRIADPDDVLAPLRDLVEALSTSPIATAFYSFSSLNRLCFSASSHYPWVADDLPVVAPLGRGMYQVDQTRNQRRKRVKTRCDLRDAEAMILAALKASPVRPFFGSAVQHELPVLFEGLVRRGSSLRPKVEQHGAWYELVVADSLGARRCEVSDGCSCVVFIEGPRRLYTSWRRFDDAIDAISRYCEGGASLDQIASDPRAEIFAERA